MPSSTNFAIWWDGDLSRELLDHHWDATKGYGTGKIDKWDYETNTTINLLTAEDTASNNSTKGNPSLQADLVGDWREEAIWRSADSSELRIFTTTDVTDKRIYTLMHDRVYRLGVAWQNVAYNQPPHTSFYLGNNMAKPVFPDMYVVANASIKMSPHVIHVKNNGGEYRVTGKVTLPFKQRLSGVQMKVNGKQIAGEVQGNIVKFEQQDILNILDGELGEIEVTVSGTLENGYCFSGQDTMTFIK